MPKVREVGEDMSWGFPHLTREVRGISPRTRLTTEAVSAETVDGFRARVQDNSAQRQVGPGQLGP